MGDSSSPQLAPGVTGTEGVWTGGGGPLYGLKRQPPLETPRSEIGIQTFVVPPQVVRTWRKGLISLTCMMGGGNPML